MTHHTDPTARLLAHLDQIAERLVELGTGPETHRLAELAEAIESTAPGAAAALTDPDGSEISRLRAFAVASATVLRLPVTGHVDLLHRFERPSTCLAAA